MGPGGPLSDIDLRLMVVIKRSQAYRAIRGRVAKPFPSDHWHEDGMMIAVFDLEPAGFGAAPQGPGKVQAVFVAASHPPGLVAARLVEYATEDGDPRALDLMAEQDQPPDW